jgi:hypothetical protein
MRDARRSDDVTSGSSSWRHPKISRIGRSSGAELADSFSALRLSDGVHMNQLAIDTWRKGITHDLLSKYWSQQGQLALLDQSR